tara:strand:- start:70061 stop:70681 length:621 start_codon:yes stop_codon:yes gene_type:complete
MLSKSSFIIVSLLVISVAWANRIGNGGNVVVCNDMIQVLDFYEAETASKFPTDSEKMDYKAIADEVFKRLKPISKKLGKQYKDRLGSIIQEIDFKEGVALTDVKDSLFTFKPEDKNCEVQQIAIRKDISLPNEKRFVIDKKLWDRLDSKNKSALIVHEIIYEHLNKLGETTSVKARKIVAYLYSDQITSKEFWNIIKSLKLPIYPD